MPGLSRDFPQGRKNIQSKLVLHLYAYFVIYVAAGPALAKAKTPTPVVPPSPLAVPGACTLMAANTLEARHLASSAWQGTIQRR